MRKPSSFVGTTQQVAAALLRMAGFVAYYVILIALIVWVAVTYARAEPLAARQYRADLTREAHAHWGLDAPIALLAGQVEQESAWRPNVCSPYACGLAQFTSGTATWISARYGNLLGGANVFNPQWALRALVIYDRDLYRARATAATDRDRWAFTLSSYNGGAGNLNREIAKCRALPPCDPSRWEGHVDGQSARADWAYRENRGYPRAIFRRQLAYTHWGRTVL